VARGLGAAQRPNGKFPSLAFYGPSSAIAIEPPSPLPDRGSTRASLGLLLSVMGDPDGDLGVIGRGAARGAKWLLKQQAETGAWVILWPGGADVRDASRLVRLDTGDTRDSTVAALLAYETLGDPFQRRVAERSVEYLMKARTGLGAEVGGGLWQTAYSPVGVVIEKSTDFPPGTDLLASRYSMQTLLAVWAVLGDGQRMIAAGQSATAIEALETGDDGKWHRRYDNKGASTDPKPSDKPFGPVEEVVVGSDPGLGGALEAVAAAKAAGRDKFRERLAQTLFRSNNGWPWPCVA